MVNSLLSRVYEKIVKMRNRRYDKDEKLIVKLNSSVISVGNLTVGGTGKTPFVKMLTRELLALGIKPGIVGRGYKRKSSGEVIVSDGKKLLVDSRTGGDEMVLLAEATKVPIIAHDSKAEAAISMERRFDVDCIIIDDGFQHRALKRNIDIVLIDKETLDNPSLLPKGRLREPLSSLDRADVICLTGNTEITDELKSAARINTLFIKVKPIAEKPYLLHNSFYPTISELDEFRKGIIPIAGIAKPNRFFDMIKVMGFHSFSPLSFPDHHYFNRNDIERIRRHCEELSIKKIAITEKDAVKLREFNSRLSHIDISALVFPINLTISMGRKEFINLIKLKIM